MKIGAIVCLYNRDLMIGPYLEQLTSHGIDCIVMLGEKAYRDPGRFEADTPDKSEEIVKKYFPQVKIIKGNFSKPRHQWNEGMQYFKDYDRVIINDCDLFLENKDFPKFIDFISQDYNVFAVDHETMLIEYYSDHKYGKEALKGGYPPLIAVKPQIELINMVMAKEPYTKVVWTDPDIKWHHFRFCAKGSLTAGRYYPAINAGVINPEEFKPAPEEITNLLNKWKKIVYGSI